MTGKNRQYDVIYENSPIFQRTGDSVRGNATLPQKTVLKWVLNRKFHEIYRVL